MYTKQWNWLQKNWPHFSYNRSSLEQLEFEFINNIGKVSGALKYVEKDLKSDLLVEILSNEAIKTSEIEGDILNRQSVQSSIKKNLGLQITSRKASLAESGIAELMVDLYQNYDRILNHQQLWNWHKMITNGRKDLVDIGAYRTHKDLMQVVSGRIDKPSIHFQAPPSEIVFSEMENFVSWFQKNHFSNKSVHLPLAKAGIAHLYFVCIHPFEDGNGRIARAIAEKSVALSVGQPTLISLSNSIENDKKRYYQALEDNNKSLEITDWLMYFGETIIEAQKETINRIDFIIQKARFLEKFSKILNERQQKVILRMFKAGHSGFLGGLSAEKYIKITKTSASTATRDLRDLTEKQVLIKTGSLKSTRYQLNIKKD